ncbi:MAG: fumarylacetoacetate hydrolase family protein [Firmicutes bacterium]|nr:fumarylacetoacetate hydrolase family protein [Bacillota bacterium]
MPLFKSAADAVRDVRNIFCVGRNYGEHARELGNDVPAEPIIFGKSTHAAMAIPGTGIVDVSLPSTRDNIHYETEVVLWISREYQRGMKVSDMVSGIALGLDLTDRDAQNRLKAQGQPWEYAKGFRHSAVWTDFYSVTEAEWDQVHQTPFTMVLERGGQQRVAQEGQLSEMIFPLQTLIDYVGQRFYLAPGDVLYTGTPAGVGPLQTGDVAQLSYGDKLWGSCRFV